METRSSLELMLERIQRMDDRPNSGDPPALPVRAALPPGRRSLPIRRGHFKSKRTNKEEYVHQQRSIERENVQEFLLVAVSVPESIEECALKKNGKLVDDEHTREREVSIEVIVGIQKCFRAHQARYRYHELKRGIITLQSFVRGEIARKNYQLLVKRQTAAIFLQCAVRGCLARKNINCTENVKIPSVDSSNIMIRNLDSKNQKPWGYIQVPYADVVELQRRVWRAEAELVNKKEENVSLKLQIEQYEKKWQLYEAKMKSMEEMWQDQLTSIQVTLATKGERSPTTENTTPQRANIRLNTIAHFISRHQDELNDREFEPSTIVELKYSGRLATPTDPKNELKRLENQFEEWEKEYKTRLRETKTNFYKLGKWRVKKKNKWWWKR